MPIRGEPKPPSYAVGWLKGLIIEGHGGRTLFWSSGDKPTEEQELIMNLYGELIKEGALRLHL